ncbi:MAG: SDR family NAD(P)-dependent oxidoreductase [Propionibacteriaceae bacterium]
MTASTPSPTPTSSDGPVAVVTGGASGIGRAACVALAGAGFRVAFGFHPGDPHDPEETVEEVRAHGGECFGMAADVRSSEAVDALVGRAVGTYGRLDAVVANAGILRRASLAELTDQSWHDMLDVDLGGVLRVFRAGAAHLPVGGALVAVSSMTGAVYGWADHSHYATAKAGVIGLVRSLAVELGPRGVRVNAILPGLVATPQSLDEQNSLGPDGLEAAAVGVPLRRVGRPEDIAAVVRFLCGPESGYVSGASIRVDGGLTIAQP